MRQFGELEAAIMDRLLGAGQMSPHDAVLLQQALDQTHGRPGEGGAR